MPPPGWTSGPETESVTDVFTPTGRELKKGMSQADQTNNHLKELLNTVNLQISVEFTRSELPFISTPYTKMDFELIATNQLKKTIRSLPLFMEISVMLQRRISMLGIMGRNLKLRIQLPRFRRRIG